jgi:hypothetical protein
VSATCPHNGQHSDAAKRVYDTYTLHRMAAGDNAYGQWMACALSDGRSDNTLYDSRGEAVRHQKHNEDRYVFIPIRPGSFTLCDAETLLKCHRLLAATQKALIDRDHPAGGRQIIPRLTTEDQRSSVLSILTGSKPSNLIIGE